MSLGVQMGWVLKCRATHPYRNDRPVTAPRPFIRPEILDMTIYYSVGVFDEFYNYFLLMFSTFILYGIVTKIAIRPLYLMH